jgi:hypothetical protein
MLRGSPGSWHLALSGLIVKLTLLLCMVLLRKERSARQVRTRTLGNRFCQNFLRLQFGQLPRIDEQDLTLIRKISFLLF